MIVTVLRLLTLFPLNSKITIRISFFSLHLHNPLPTTPRSALPYPFSPHQEMVSVFLIRFRMEIYTKTKTCTPYLFHLSTTSVFFKQNYHPQTSGQSIRRPLIIHMSSWENVRTNPPVQNRERERPGGKGKRYWLTSINTKTYFCRTIFYFHIGGRYNDLPTRIFVWPRLFCNSSSSSPLFSFLIFLFIFWGPAFSHPYHFGGSRLIIPYILPWIILLLISCQKQHFTNDWE